MGILKFEDKLKLAIEMTNARIELAMSPDRGHSTLLGESLPVDNVNNAYADCVKAMFEAISELEKRHEQTSL